ncbi:hypothetical protein NIES3585_07080 [Nodularia sp. NIES-3585]|nr:hypothetical protein NIES3585_07080 [Nodularia sp. NIES-3585]
MSRVMLVSGSITGAPFLHSSGLTSLKCCIMSILSNKQDACSGRAKSPPHNIYAYALFCACHVTTLYFGRLKTLNDSTSTKSLH